MARTYSDRTSHVQTQAAKPVQPAAEAAVTAEAAPATVLPWGWQVALFVWLASFVFLALNDLLQCIFKVVTH
jgi:hypothetical protein